MIYQAPYPSELAGLEYVRLYLYLRMEEDVYLPPGTMLQLRRELLSALKLLEREREPEDLATLRQILAPAPPQDSELCRRVQRPSASLVLSPELGLEELRVGAELCLPVLLLGRCITCLPQILDLVEAVGTIGLHKGRGRFSLNIVEAEDPSGVRSFLWQNGAPRPELTPPVSDLGWWLDGQGLAAETLTLEFLTPARLIRDQRPLFKANFSELFPFILRRVSQVLGQHLETVSIDTPDYLIRQAATLAVADSSLNWFDWRSLERDQGKQSLGGLLGTICVAGDALGELFWILKLGELLQIGKGAAFGAGRYRLIKA